MAAVLHRLKSHIGNTPEQPLKGKRVAWEFKTGSQEVDYNYLVRNHSALNIEYSLLCTRLVHNAAQPAASTKELKDAQEKALVEQLIAALVMAELLAHMYCYYIYMSHEVLRLQKEQEVYRSLLNQCGFNFKELPDYPVKSSFSFSQKVRNTTAELNWTRLFTIRIRRVLTTLVPLIRRFEAYYNIITFLDQFAAPALNYVAWVFYTPRLSANLIGFLEHLIPGPWRAAKEHELLMLSIFLGQLQNRWFEIGNDTAWLICGVLGCFVLTGTLAPVAMYVSIAIFFFDVLMASLRAVVELRRIKKMLDEYDALAVNMSGEELAELNEHRDFLKQHLRHEKKRLLLSIFSTSALFLAMCFAIPAFSINPVIPFIGAILVLAITLTTFLLSRYLEKQRPSQKVDDLAKKAKSIFANSPHVLFQPFSEPQTFENDLMDEILVLS